MPDMTPAQWVQKRREQFIAESTCPTCKAEGQTGTCARLRCYCGHKDCWAFDSYVPTRNK